MVTAELAIGVLITALALFAAAAMIGLLITQDRAESLASQTARHAARGDAEQVEALKQRAPRGSQVTIDKSEGWVRVHVAIPRSWGRVGSVTLTAEAQAPLEPGES